MMLMRGRGTVTLALLTLQVVSAGRFMASNPVEFRRRLKVIRQEIAPASLSQKDSATLASSSVLWMDVNLVRAQGLAVMDASGSSDPFVTASIAGETRQSTVKMRSLNPVWDEHLVFSSVPYKPDLTISINVWDWDTDRRQELIGSATLTIADVLDQEGSVSHMTTTPRA